MLQLISIAIFSFILYLLTLRVRVILSKITTNIVTDNIIKEVADKNQPSDMQKNAITLLYKFTIVQNTSIYTKIFLGVVSIAASGVIYSTTIPLLPTSIIFVLVVLVTSVYCIYCESYFKITSKLI